MYHSDGSTIASASSGSTASTSSSTVTIRNEPLGLDDFPSVMHEIFRYFPLTEVFSKFRLVNKRWFRMVDDFRVHRLVIANSSDNLPLDPQSLCEPELFDRLSSSVYLSELKFLHLIRRPSVFLGRLNIFKQLKALVISINLDDQELYLCLPSLRRIEFSQVNRYTHIRLDCPSLEELYYQELEEDDLLDVKQPTTVRILRSTFHGRKLARFKELRYYECFFFDQSFRLLEENTLFKLANLETVEFNNTVQCLMDENSFDDDDDAGWPGSREQLINWMLSQFFRRRQERKRFGLILRFAGVRLDNVNVRDFVRAEYPEEFYVRNYRFLQSDLGFVEELNYSRLTSLTTILPKNVFERFCGIQKVCLSHAPAYGEQHLMWFLSRTPRLKEVDLVEPRLSQMFYTDFLTNFTSLTSFSITEENELNYTFLGRFQRLIWLNLRQRLCVPQAITVLESFENLPDLNEDQLSLNVYGLNLNIVRHQMPLQPEIVHYELKVNSTTVLDGMTLPDLITFLQDNDRLAYH